MNNKIEYLKRPAVVGALALFCCLLWGSAFPCIKIGYRLFQIESWDVASQIFFAGLRFTLAGCFTIVLGSLLRRRALIPPGTSLGMIVRLGAVQTVLQYLLFYIGLAHTTGVKSSIIEAANVFLALLFSCFLFRFEHMTWQKLAGCVFGFFGVVMINWSDGGLGGGLRFFGEGFILLSTAAYALSSGLIKKYSQREDPVLLSGWQFFFGGLVMTAAGWGLGGRIRTADISSLSLLAYLGLLSAIAYSLWGILLKYNSVGQVAVYGFMNPVFGVLLSSVLLQEKNQAFSPQGLMALFLVCIGIFLCNRSPKKGAEG